MLKSVLNKYNCYEVSAMELYSDMFQFDNDFIQKENETSNDFKANPLGYGKNHNKETGNYKVMFSDTFEKNLKFLQSKDFAILNGITYFGRKNVQSHASKMFAMIIDLDGVDEQGLNNYFFASNNGLYPLANYIALSGHGVHLYFLFDEPIDLYPNIKTQLKDLKYALMKRIWNKSITSEYEKIQYQGINQGFRVIGGKTKVKGKVVGAYKVHDNKFTPSELCEYVNYETEFNEEKKWNDKKLNVEQAKKLYPEWYERVVIKKETLRGGWTCKPDLYNWWLRRIKTEAVVGHRYFCVMCLGIYAIKSGVSEEQLKEDAYSLLELFNQVKDVEPFLESDIDSALECYDLKYLRFPIKDISKISALEIVKNKRNGRCQKDHVIVMNKMKEVKKLLGENINEGRPSKEKVVREWIENNPNGIKSDCIKETGLSKMTVYKWWK